MASDNEMVADIVREMRNDAIAADAWHETHGEMASAASTLNRHANRIEAAHRREMEHQAVHNCELRAKSGNCGLTDEIKAHRCDVESYKRLLMTSQCALEDEIVKNQNHKREVAELRSALKKAYDTLYSISC